MKTFSFIAITFFLISNLVSAENFISNDQNDYAGLASVKSHNSGTLFGTLRDKDTGLPVTGAQVTITNSATGDIVFTGTTDSNGDFKYDNAEQGTNYSVEYCREHFYTVTMENVVIGAMGFKNVNALAALKTSSNGAIGGTVVTEDQLNLADTQINVFPLGGTEGITTMTDDHGTFVVPNLSPGEYIVWPSYQGRQVAESFDLSVNEMLKWQVFENITNPLNAEPGTVTFQVNGNDGTPIQNAQVTIPGVGTKFSDIQGNVEIPNLPEGIYSVTARAADHYSDVKTLQVNEEPPSRDTLNLYPTKDNKAIVVGSIRDASSNGPVAGVNVEIKFQDQSFTTTSSSSGDFRIEDVPALGSYTAKYSKPGYHTTVQKREVEAVSKKSTIKNILLANKVEGHGAICIKIKSKQAQDNIENVQLFGFDQSLGYFGETAQVGADVRYLDGEIVITKVPVNADLIMIWLKDGSNVQFKINVEDCHMIECTINDEMILSKQGSKIFGKVKDQESGNGEGTVEVSADSQASGQRLAASDEPILSYLNGEFFVDNLTPGTPYQLTFTADGMNTTEMIIDSPEETAATFNEVLLAASSAGKGAVAGIVEGLGLTKIATVQISSGGSTITLEDNSYLLNNITPGDYIVTASYAGNQKSENVTIESGITKQINFDFYYEALTSVEIIDDEIPIDYLLYQNYPNPFNPVTTIKFSIPQKAYVSLAVYSLTGEKINDLVNEEMYPGSYEVKFDASKLSSGVYFYQLSAGEFIDSKKIVLLK